MAKTVKEMMIGTIIRLSSNYDGLKSVPSGINLETRSDSEFMEFRIQIENCYRYT